MTQCPKCGSCEVSGPKYCSGSVVVPYEHLQYVCLRCGFVGTTRTLDAKPPLRSTGNDPDTSPT